MDVEFHPNPNLIYSDTKSGNIVPTIVIDYVYDEHPIE